MSRYEHITYEVRDRVATITLCRSKWNPINRQTQIELSSAWQEFAGDPRAWVAIITADGNDAFSVGSDLKEAGANGYDPYGQLDATDGGFGGIARRFDLLKPIVAAVNGYAIGGGLDMVLACDLVVAATHAEFAMPEAAVGGYAGFGGLERLVRKVPENIANEMVLLGRRLTADEAHQFGLVNYVVDPTELQARAADLARQLLEISPLAIQANKQAIRMAQDIPLEQACSAVPALVGKLWRSPDAQEGSKAFTEKRAARWADPS